MKEKVITKANAEYVHLIEDVNVWFIDYVIGVAFRTPVNFTDKMNGLRESGRAYREFSNYKDMQDYLDEITGQEIVFESSIDPESDTEYDSKMVWNASYAEKVWTKNHINFI